MAGCFLTFEQICALIDKKMAALVDLGMVKLGQGDTLPENVTNVPLIVQTPGGQVTVPAGGELPADMIGCVFVDPDEPGAAIYVTTDPASCCLSWCVVDADGVKWEAFMENGVVTFFGPSGIEGTPTGDVEFCASESTVDASPNYQECIPLQVLVGPPSTWTVPPLPTSINQWMDLVVFTFAPIVNNSTCVLTVDYTVSISGLDIIIPAGLAGGLFTDIGSVEGGEVRAQGTRYANGDRDEPFGSSASARRVCVDLQPGEEITPSGRIRFFYNQGGPMFERFGSAAVPVATMEGHFHYKGEPK